MHKTSMSYHMFLLFIDKSLCKFEIPRVFHGIFIDEYNEIKKLNSPPEMK